MTKEGNAVTATYDAEDRLILATYTDSNSVAHSVSFTYGADDLMYKQVIDGVETRFVRDGYQIVQERDSSNAVTRSYVWDPTAPGGIGGLLEVTQGGAHYNYLYDGRGNVAALTDASQAVVAEYRYDSFGDSAGEWNAPGFAGQPYRFSTKRLYAGIGVLKYELRDYLPFLAKWGERDPIGEEGGLNLYGAMGNSAVNYVDPYGDILDTVLDVGAVGYDLYELYKKPSWENAGWLAVDTGSALVPFVPAAGILRVVGKGGEGAIKAAKAAEEVAEIEKAAGVACHAKPRGMQIPHVKASAAEGIVKHNEWYPTKQVEGFITNKQIPGSSLKPDALHPELKLIIELKPKGSRAGKRRQKDYIRDANKAYGGDFKAEFEYYEK